MELIKREDVHKLISSLNHYIWKNPNQYNSNLPKFKETVGADDLHFEIDKLPIVDAEPVKHGHYSKSEYCSECYDDLLICSECNIKFLVALWDINWEETRNPIYCPNCGAKMERNITNGET